jgi:hypothetical protein
MAEMQIEAARLQYAAPAEEETKRELARVELGRFQWLSSMVVVVGVTVGGFVVLEPHQLQWLLVTVVAGLLGLNVVQKLPFGKPKA